MKKIEDVYISDDLLKITLKSGLEIDIQTNGSVRISFSKHIDCEVITEDSLDGQSVNLTTDTLVIHEQLSHVVSDEPDYVLTEEDIEEDSFNREAGYIE
jgi:hypothetical protein